MDVLSSLTRPLWSVTGCMLWHLDHIVHTYGGTALQYSSLVNSLSKSRVLDTVRYSN